MANHPQAEKRNRQRIKKQAHHRHYKSKMRTSIKQVLAAIEDKDVPKAKEALKQAIPVIDRCAQKGVLPDERASRTISRLSKSVNALSS